MMNYIDQRLRDIKDRRDKLFGGANLLACGDLSQLAPVEDCWVFEHLGTPAVSASNVPDENESQLMLNRKTKIKDPRYLLYHNLWKDNCVCYELTKIMRTENKEFADLQHRLRELRFDGGKLQKMKQEDVDYLNVKCVGNSEDKDINR